MWTEPPFQVDHGARSRRDAALERVGSITKGIALVSVAAVAAIGIYVSRAVPGHSTTPAKVGGTVSGGSSAGGAIAGGSSAGGAIAGGSSAGGAPVGPGAGTAQPSSLSPPNNPPTQTQQQAPVVSGAT